MLTLKKSITLNGEVFVEDKLAVTLQANITAENAGNSFINQSIINQELYNANRKTCREEIKQFQEEVFNLEDVCLNDEKAAE